MKSYRYRGNRIYECECAPSEHRGGWFIQAYHPTGIPYSDELCPHFQSIHEAKEAIREWQATRP